MILMPEQRLKALMDYYLDSINEEYLFDLFGGQTFGDGYDYFTNAKTIFLKTNDDPRKVVSNIFFNRDRQGLPTIHIALNQDILGEGNGLGFDPSTEIDELDETYKDTYTRTYSSRFNIICTSDNTFEVLIVYNVLRALFQGNPQLLQKAGLTNAKLTGNDMILTDYLMPSTIYARGLILDCLYEITVPSLKKNNCIKDIFVNQISIKDNE